MKTTRAGAIFVSLIITLILATLVARADLSFVLTSSTQNGAGTNAAVFTGLFVNTSTSNLLFLNQAQLNFFNTGTNSPGADTNTFYFNVPGILLPGETYTGAVFGVTLPSGIAPADYFGSVAIAGGSNIFANDLLTNQIFRIAWPDSVGDGIPDWWRAQFFGGTGTTTNAQSCAACDADNTGQNNLFKYFAGLDPTNSLSVFVLKISQSFHPALLFGPIAPGRIYVPQYSPNLTNWLPLGVSIIATNVGDQLMVTDPNPEATRFYRIQIKLP